jgi:hypothetical protein
MYSKAYPTLKAGWYAVFILLLAYILSFVDRIIMSLLVIPIQQDLGTSDAQMGLLMGFAFALFIQQLVFPLLGYPMLKAEKLLYQSVFFYGV